MEYQKINIALPKGRLGDKVYFLLASAGYKSSEFEMKERKLVFSSNNALLSYFWVKPQDVATYVELGAADVGIVGKDILDEEKPDVFELLDTKLGVCKMCVCGVKEYVDTDKKLRVATKYPAIAKEYFKSRGKDIHVIRLNGSIELAPLLGLSDVIVDIVETGRTLKENGLKILDKISDYSARVVANKSAYNFKTKEISAFLQKIGDKIC